MAALSQVRGEGVVRTQRLLAVPEHFQVERLGPIMLPLRPVQQRHPLWEVV